jgi:ferrous iron transport protein A
MVKVNNRDSVLHGTNGNTVQEAGVTLDSLKPGEKGSILKVTADADLKLHLLELGFVTGSPIVFLMTTPFGDPNIYTLRGTSIALRKSEAQCIRVLI